MNTTTTELYKRGLEFDWRFVEHKSFYLSLHKTLPDLHYIGALDGEKAFLAFIAAFGAHVAQTHSYRWFKRNKGYQFARALVQLHQPMTIEFSTDYIEMLHDGSCEGLVTEFTDLFRKFFERSKRTPREINLIIRGEEGPELKAVEIKRTRLDIGLYYEDDFGPVDAEIRRRLSKKNDKGIVLLHGLPGTGKTSYLRHLAGVLKKPVLFLSAGVAGNLMEPSFLQLLMDNPNAILIIEDAENILADRRSGNSSAVSGLLNISDGLLADFLHLQIICTFNSPLYAVDPALLREGRLIAPYAFGKLSAEKAQRLSDHLRLNRIITEPATLAEIMHPAEHITPARREPVIGFRRALSVN